MNRRTLLLRTIISVFILFAVWLVWSDKEIYCQDEFEVPNSVIRNRLDFEMDANEDNFPDGWYKVKGDGYPHYIEGLWDTSGKVSGKYSLRVDLKGGNLTFLSDKILLKPEYTYIFGGFIKTSNVQSEGLLKTSAFFKLNFLDRQGVSVQAIDLDGLTGSNDWTYFQFSTDELAKFTSPVYLQISCNVSGRSLAGKVWFDGITLKKVPKISVKTDRLVDVFEKGTDLKINVKITGLDNAQYCCKYSLKGETSGQSHYKSSDFEPANNKFDDVFVFPCDVVDKFSFQVDLFKKNGDDFILITRKVFYLLVVNRLCQRSQDKFFGISINPYRFGDWKKLEGVLDYVPFDRVKLSIWDSTLDYETLEDNYVDVLDLVKHISKKGAIVVGVFDGPVQDLQNTGTAESSSKIKSMGELFTRKDSDWKNLFRDTLNRFSDLIRCWQISSDEDSRISRLTSEYLDLPIEDIRSFVVNSCVGVPVDFATAEEVPTTVDFLSVNLYKDMSISSFEEFLKVFIENNPPEYIKTWVNIDLLDEDKYSADAQISDLVKKAVLAKYYGAESLFLKNPVGKTRSLLDEDLSVEAILLGYFNLYDMLAGFRCIERFSTIAGTDVFIFQGGDTVRFVMWNNLFKCDEELYLPETVKILNMLGQGIEPIFKDEKLVVSVSDQPLFITDIPPVHHKLMRGLTLESKRIFSTVDDQYLRFQFEDKLDEAIQVELRFLLDELWSPDRTNFSFNLNPGKSFSQKIKINLPYNEMAGLHCIEALGVFEVGLQKFVKRFKLPIEIAISGFDVSIEKELKGNCLILVASVKNLSTKKHNLTSYCLADGKRLQSPNPSLTVYPSEEAQFFFKVDDVSVLEQDYLLFGFTVENDNRFYNKKVKVKEGDVVIISE